MRKACQHFFGFISPIDKEITVNTDVHTLRARIRASGATISDKPCTPGRASGHARASALSPVNPVIERPVNGIAVARTIRRIWKQYFYGDKLAARLFVLAPQRMRRIPVSHQPLLPERQGLRRQPDTCRSFSDTHGIQAPCVFKGYLFPSLIPP